MGACGGGGVGGRPDPPDGRNSDRDRSLDFFAGFFRSILVLYPSVSSLKIDHWSVLVKEKGKKS